MIISILSLIAMAGMALYMLLHARYAVTRKVAAVPLAVCVMELMVFGVTAPVGFPVLTMLLIAMKTLILLCCAGAMRRDMMQARRRERRMAALRAAESRRIAMEKAEGEPSSLHLVSSVSRRSVQEDCA
ncbi:MAG: hypothetical protein HFJ80_05205 [Clostridiales bacterium]|nr:hypothetical protein [Clostridiales bacterium]